MTSRWENLVTEAQFATELSVLGLRRLCTVPTAPNRLIKVSYDQSYPLHVGLLSFTSGLERLCKLTIACHGYVRDGVFPPLRQFGHSIGGLLDAVEDLDLGSIRTVGDLPRGRPDDELDPELTNLLERYADGSGRYEHLDSLWNDDAVVRTLEVWSDLCARTTLPPEVRDLLALRDGAVEAIADLTIDAGLETAAEPYINELVPLSDPSIGVALALYQKASWVATTLDFVTYYTSRELPIVGEALNAVRHSNEDFFKYEVARINDVECVEGELRDYLARMRGRPDNPPLSESDLFDDA